MAGGSAIRNRSEIVAVSTPRGPVDVVQQEQRGLRGGSTWRWFWLARRRSGRWCEANTARDAIRQATLLAPKKLPAWLHQAAADAERQVQTVTQGRGLARKPSG